MKSLLFLILIIQSMKQYMASLYQHSEQKKVLRNYLVRTSMVILFLTLGVIQQHVQAQCTTTNMTTTVGASVSASGINGICLGCSVTNTANLTNASTTDFATIGLSIGVLASGYIDVTLPQTYPAGTRIGFVMDLNGGLAGLLNGTTLYAYNGSTLVGTASSGSLINILGIGGGTNVNAVFCQPFNKIRIQVGSLAGVFATYKVYYAYVNEGCSFPVQCGLATASPEICGDGIDNDGDGLIDSEDTCITCAAGSTAPALSATTKSNVCPISTVDLTTITATNLPSNTTLTWHTGTPATTANKITGTAVAGGTYYAAFYDATNNCYSGSATTAVTVTTTICTVPQCGIAPSGAQFDGVGFYGDNNVPTGAVTPHLKGGQLVGLTSVSDMAAGSGATLVAAQHSGTSTLDVSGVSGNADFATAIANNDYTFTNVVPTSTSYFTAHRFNNSQGSYTLGVAVFDGTTLTQLGTVASTSTGAVSITFTTPYLMQAGASYQIRYYYINATATTSWTDNPVLSFKASAVYPAPALSSTSASAACPATVNLTTITASNTPTSPSGTALTWHTGTPATTDNKITGTNISTSGTYYAAFYDATNSCYSLATTATTVTIAACIGIGTVDCSKTEIYEAPVAGTSSQLDLAVTLNVTSVGVFTPVTVSGSGMSLTNGVSSVTTTTTGIQKIHIPIKYDGTALGTVNFTIGTAGSCAANLSSIPTKKVLKDIWTLDNCAPIMGPGIK